jgi:hypothetical protein
MFLESATAVNDFFADVHIPLDCEFLVAQRSNGTEDGDVKFSLTEVYRVHPTRPLQAHRVANWSSASGFTWSTIPACHRRRDFQGIVLKGAFITDVYDAKRYAFFVCYVKERQRLFLRM